MSARVYWSPGIADRTTKAQATFAYVPVGGNPNNPIVMYYRSEDTVNPTSGCMQQPNYCVRDSAKNCLPSQYQTTCTNSVSNTTPIKVCYSRGSQQKCDYFHSNNAHPTNFVFPLKGSVQFQNTLVSPLKGIVTITLENPHRGGGCYLKFKELAPLGSEWSSSGQQLSWNFPSAAFPDPHQCLEFYGGTSTYLHVQVDGIALQGGSGPPPFGGFKFTSDRSQNIGQPGVYIVPEIEIEQGCFAAGTEIRMSDDSLKKVENFTADHLEVVKTGDDEHRVVLGTSRGTEPFPMVRLQTEAGHDLLVTRTHPIVTPNGAVMATDLTVGDIVETEDGEAKLSSVSREPFSGQVYNLRIGDMEDAKNLKSTLYANGILTGAMRMQRYVEQLENEKLSTDPQHVLKRLAPEWHDDYRAYLKMKQNRPYQ